MDEGKELLLTNQLKRLVSTAANYCVKQDLAAADLSKLITNRVHQIWKDEDEKWKRARKVLTWQDYQEKHGLNSKEISSAYDLGLIVKHDEVSPRGHEVYLDRKYFTQADRRKISANTFYSITDSADRLNVSVSTIRKWIKAGKIEPKVPPWNKDGRYDAKFLVQADLDLIGAREVKGPSEALKNTWADLNDRQQKYLEVVYKRELSRSIYYTSSNSMYSPLRKDGEWRWIQHTSDLFDFERRSGLDGILARLKLLDQGTGSTYKALEARGLVELKTEVGMIETLWVKLTKMGRRLIKAFYQR